MKLTISLIALLLLAGCGVRSNNIEDGGLSVANFSTVCLDGTAYWIRATGNKSYMAVRIDPATRQPKVC